MSVLLSDFYPKADAVLISGNQVITGFKTFKNRVITPEISSEGFPGVMRKINLVDGQMYGGSNIVSLDYFNRILSGNWQFENRPTVSGVGVLLQGEAAGGSSIENVVYTTGSQTITSTKDFTVRPTLSGVPLITTGDLVDLELNIEGALSSSTAFNGDREIKALPVLNTNYGGTTISGFLENMFFPYQFATVTLNSFPILTYGINTINSISFAGSITKKDDIVTGIAYRKNSSILSGPSPRSNIDGSYNTVPIPLGETLSSTFQSLNTLLYVTEKGVSKNRISELRPIRFEPIYYYGLNASDDLTMGDTYDNSIFNVFNTSNPASYTYSLGSRPDNVIHTFEPNNQYIYFIYPSPASTQDIIINWGNSLNSIYDVNANFEYITTYSNLGTINIEFPNHTLRYRVYRSNDLITLQPGESLDLRFTFGN